MNVYSIGSKSDSSYKSVVAETASEAVQIYSRAEGGMLPEVLELMYLGPALLSEKLKIVEVPK